MSARSISAFVLGSVCSYTGWIEYNDRSHKFAKQRSLNVVIDNRKSSLNTINTQNPISSAIMITPTSTDNMILDSLNTGDIVLFHREWYRYHIPVALLILSNQYFQQYDYDHCGVVIQDTYGEVYLFENTPFGGYKLRRLDERLHYSKSSQVTVIPLVPRIAFTNPVNEKKKTNLMNKIDLMTHKSINNDDSKNKKDRMTCEVADWIRSFYYPIPSFYYTISKMNSLRIDKFHPNALPVVECYDELNVQGFFSSVTNREISIKNIVEGKIQFLYSPDTPMEDLAVQTGSTDQKQQQEQQGKLTSNVERSKTLQILVFGPQVVLKTSQNK